MDLKQETLRFIEHMQNLYFEQRNMEGLLSAVDENTSWIGTGIQEFFRNFKDAKTALSLETQDYRGRFTITQTKYDAVCLSDTVCVVYGEITAKPDNPVFADAYNRLTAVCVRTPDGMKLAHLHLSAPDEADQQEALMENTLGGIHQCACDSGMTLLGMSQGFLSLVGYTQEEIRQRFHNCFAEMIHKDDLPRVQAEMAYQLSIGEELELEYRILCGDGRQLWILDHGRSATLADGRQCCYCMLLDNTKQKQEREELRLSLERHRIITDQTTDIIFEWDITRDTLTFSSNWRKKFGYDPISESISKGIPKSLNIHKEDMPAFLKIMEDSAAGVPYSETEFRIRDIFGNFTWSRIRATVQYDIFGRPIKAVGVIIDIHSDKKRQQQLLEQAQRDSLTNLYNKAAIQELIEEKISHSTSKTNHALMIIDVDNFKQVNDVYGHLCGDSLLADVAGTLRSQFRSSDLIARIGGDEFLVYISGTTGESAVAKKVEAVLTALQQLRPARDAPFISCSIGVALHPRDADDYFSLFKCADMALYQMLDGTVSTPFRSFA